MKLYFLTLSLFLATFSFGQNETKSTSANKAHALSKENGIMGGWDLGGRIVRIHEGKYRTKNGEVKDGLLVYPTTNMADIAYPVKVLVGDTIRFEIIDQNSNLMADVVEKKIYFHNNQLYYLSEKMKKM